jgi:[ribosomal protein S18]-alanine N-acetyltransferase
MMALEQQSPAAAHWSRPQYDAMFNASSRQQSKRLAWIAEDESATPEVLAFLIAQRVDSEWVLENIVVAAQARRRGVGKLLLGQLIEHARAAQGRRIFLEVRESNLVARALYRNAGFAETSLRKSYYADPPEDAILCRLRLY